VAGRLVVHKIAGVLAESGADLATAGADGPTCLNSEQLPGNVDPGAEAAARLFERLRA